MSKKTETKIIITCDWCGKEMYPIKTGSIILEKRYNMDLLSYISILPSCFIPYSIEKGDVCVDCLENAMISYVQKLKMRRNLDAN